MTPTRVSPTRLAEYQVLGTRAARVSGARRSSRVSLIEVTDKSWRECFDAALDATHYAGACQRVGRCMRLAIVQSGEWVGGIVLGSTFPNIEVRDQYLGLKR